MPEQNSDGGGVGRGFGRGGPEALRVSEMRPGGNNDPGGCGAALSRGPRGRAVVTVVGLQEPHAWAMEPIVQAGRDLSAVRVQVAVVVSVRHVTDPRAANCAQDLASRGGPPIGRSAKERE